MVLRRLAGKTENTTAALTLLTQFCGGKTHTPAALYHPASSGRPDTEPLIRRGTAPLFDPNSRSVVLGQLGESRLAAGIDADIASDHSAARRLAGGPEEETRCMEKQRAFKAALAATAWLCSAHCAGPSREAGVGQSVALGKGEFTVTRTDARQREGKAELSIFNSWTGPIEDVVGGFFGSKLKMTLRDGDGNKYKPVRPKWSAMAPVAEETYSSIMRDFDSYYTKRDGSSFERDAAANAERLERLEAELKVRLRPLGLAQRRALEMRGRRFAVGQPDFPRPG